MSQERLGAFLKYDNAGHTHLLFLMVDKKRIHYSCEDVKEYSVPEIKSFHHSASLLMPNGDLRD